VLLNSSVQIELIEFEQMGHQDIHQQ
jgi:hypothetical protein